MRKDGTTPYKSQTEWVHGRRVRIPQMERVRTDEFVNAIARNVTQVRNDGWLNALTGFGDPLRDKTHINNQFLTIDLLSQTDAEYIWRASDVAAKFIEKVPEEMTRQGFQICVEDDEESGASGLEIQEATEKWAEELDLLGKAKEALEYSRAYGGAGIFLGADDGQKDLTKPLIPERVKTFRWMNVLTPLELFPRIWYGDPHAPKYGEPMIYRIQRFVFGGAVETGFSEKIFEMPLVHESRVIRVDGIRVSRRHLRERNGWGDSVLQRVLQVISDFEQSYHGTAILASDFAQMIIKFKNLAEMVSAQDQGDLQQRIQLMDMARSVARALIIDKDEEAERKATPVSGLDKVLEQISLRLASAADMPVSLLMGQSPAGLNATGDTDVRWFYDRVKSLQQRKLVPILKRLVQIGFNSKEGPTKGREPANWSIRCNPLWQLTALEESQRRKNNADADVAYVGSQVLSPEEVAASRFGGDAYGEDITVDLESRKVIQTLDPNVPRPGPVDGVERPPVPAGELGATPTSEGTPAPKGSGAMGFKENPVTLGTTSGEPE